VFVQNYIGNLFNIFSQLSHSIVFHYIHITVLSHLVHKFEANVKGKAYGGKEAGYNKHETWPFF
jgi:hypothetical protein